ncbi:Ig-like domain-containing protein [Thalassotalea aquiviva]|uniref:Ig-like domain-containing protein n=1 Tax=Thalassotalea aquiviva TaxID=3242415 RepID=UPI00352B4D81
MKKSPCSVFPSFVSKHLLTFIFIVSCLFISAQAYAEKVSVGFQSGVVGEYSKNAHQPINIKTFSSLGVREIVISQESDNGLFGGTQGNDYAVLVTFSFTDGRVTSFNAAVNWRDTQGNTLHGIGLIVDAPVNDGTGYPVSDNSKKITYLLQPTTSNFDYSMGEISGGNAAQSGLLDALNEYLESVTSNPSDTPSVLTTSITANPTSIAADGNSTSLISVQLKDVNGNLITDNSHTVVIASDKGTISSTTYSANNTYQASLTSSTTAEEALLTATLNGVSISESTTVAFTKTITAPTANGQGIKTTEDIAKPITLSGSAVNASIAHFTIVTGPQNGTLATTPVLEDSTKIKSALTYQPNENFNGNDSFTFTVTDSLGNTSDSAEVSITVTPVNDAPVAQDDSAEVDEDSLVNIDVLSNDSDLDDTLDISFVSINTQATYGTAVVDTTKGHVVYTPNANATGSETGTDSFTYTLKDPSGAISHATVNITINPINDAPTVVSGEATASSTENVDVLSSGETIEVLQLFTDIDTGDTLKIATASATTGNVTISQDKNALIYKPADNAQVGNTDSINYQVTDGNGLATGTVTIKIVGNRAPVASSLTLTTNEDVAVTGSLVATDADDDVLTYQLVGGTDNSFTISGKGTLSVNQTTGSVNFTPVDNFFTPENAPLTFDYLVNDGTTNSDKATITITVNPINDAPVAQDDSAEVDEDSLVNIDVLSNDSDLDDILDISFVSINTQATYGTAVVDTTKAHVVYTPNANATGSDTGTDSFTYTLKDPSGAVSHATVNITINPINDAPTVVSGEATASSTENVDVLSLGKTIEVLQLFTDIDTGDTLKIATASATTGNVTISQDKNALIYKPADNAQVGNTDSINYQVTDGKGLATGTVTIKIVGNRAPVASSLTLTTNEDVAVTGSLVATDADDDVLTYQLVGGTDNSVTISGKGTLSVNQTTGAINFTPVDNFFTPENAPLTFDYLVNDGTTNSDKATITITVNPINDAPVAQDDSAEVDEDSLVNIDVLSNDSDLDDTLDISFVSINTQATYGTAVVDTTKGHVVYTPNANATGSETGTDSFTYTLKDPSGAISHATVNITINPINDAPTVVSGEATASSTENVDVLSSGETIEVLQLFTDIDTGDTLKIATASATTGNVTISQDKNALIYKPADNAQVGNTDSINYQVTDGKGLATGTVTINIVGNRAPVASSLTLTTNEDIAVSGNLVATDADDDVLTYQLVGGTDNSFTISGKGTLSVNQTTGSVNFTPVDNFFTPENAPLTFDYVVNDGTTNSDKATITITVNPINDAPVAQDDSAEVDEDSLVNIDVLSNDSDLDDTLDISFVNINTQATYGTAVVDTTKAHVVYTPNANATGSETGTDSFTYTLKDPSGAISHATVNITINPINDAPVAQDDSAEVDEDSLVNIDVLSNDSDLDDQLDITSVKIAAGPSNGSAKVNATTGVITYTPSDNFNGSDSFSYTVADSDALRSNSANVTITVNAINDAPTVVSGEATASSTENVDVLSLGKTIEVLQLFTDIDTGDTLKIATASATTGNVTISQDKNALIYKPADNAQVGNTDSINYQVTDGKGLATGTVTIKIVGNRAPVASSLTLTTNEDVAVSGSLVATDADDDVLTYQLVGGTDNSVTISGKGTLSVNKTTGSVNFTPVDNFFTPENAPLTFDYLVNDGTTNSDKATITITVNPINDAPVAQDDSAEVDEDSLVNIDVLSNDSDLDDTLDISFVSIKTQATYGTAVVDTTKAHVVYTPNANATGSETGTDSFTYTLKDPSGAISHATVNITINPINDAPVAQDDSAEVDEDSLVNIDVLSNDSDLDDQLDITSVKIAAGPSNGSAKVNATTGVITYTPNENFNGSDSFSYTVADSDALRSNSANVTITVNAINDAPIAKDDTAEVDEDNSVTIAVLDNDSDIEGQLDNTSVTIITDASDMKGSVKVNATTGVITYTPNENFNGSDSFSYTVADSDGLRSNSASVTITVEAFNDAPIAEDDAIEVNEDNKVAIDVLANDIDPEDKLAPATVEIITEPSHGDVSVNTSNGVITYTPKDNFNGKDSFSYQVSDLAGKTSQPANVVVNVKPQNDAPTLVNDLVEVDEDSAVTIDVLGNDSDIDENDGLDASTLVVVTAPSKGQVVIEEGKFVYTPDLNFNGSDTFTYQAGDNQGALGLAATVTINVKGSNDRPTAVNDNVKVNEDTPVTIDVLINDSDIDSDIDPTSISIIALPADGKVVVNNLTGELTYTPNSNFNGQDSFSYVVKDVDDATSNEATVTVSVTPVNDAPVAKNDTVILLEDATHKINVLGNDSDIEQGLDATSVTINKQPEHGQVSVDAKSGEISYVPDENFYGEDSFEYYVNDEQDARSNIAVVSITVELVNDLPFTNSDRFNVDEDTSASLPILANDRDIDGTLDISSIVITRASVSGDLTINDDGTVQYTPKADFNGTDSFEYTVADNESGRSEPATVTIIVNAVNDIPTANNQSLTVNEDTELNISLTADDKDADTLTYTITSQPLNGNLSGTGQNIAYIPDANFVGQDSFSFTVNDGITDSNIATIIIDVTPTNDAPTANGAAVQTPEDTSVTINLSGQDIDGDVLTYQIDSNPSHGSISISGGSVTYMPAPNYVGEDRFSFIVNDGSDNSAPATITITVLPGNDLPSAIEQTLSTAEDTAITITLAGTDIDGDLLTYRVITSPNHGNLSGEAPNLTYTPNSNFYGVDSFSFVVNDSSLDSAAATVSINVNEVNDAPQPLDDHVSINQNDNIVIFYPLINDTDAENDELTIVSATSNNGSVVINPDGSLSFTPEQGFTGTTTIEYVVSDGHGGTASATIVITVAKHNQAPVAVDDSFDLAYADTIELDVLINDTDPEGDNLTITKATSDFGKVDIVNNKLVLSPDASTQGDYTISYSISDTHNNSATATVYLSLNINNGPIITLPADLCDELTVNANALYTRVDLGQASAVDRFGNPVPVSLVDGKTLFPPGLNQAFWQATDSEGNTSTAMQRVCVMPLISIGKDQTLLEGESAKVGVYLNGESPVYPVVVPYSIRGVADMTDHTLVDSEVVITSGSEGYIYFDVLADTQTEDDETLIIELADTVNLGNKSVHYSTITESNIAPEISLHVQQQQQTRLIVSKNGDIVAISAQVYDPNLTDTFSYDWSNSDVELVNISNSMAEFSFDPANLAVGVYKIQLHVADSAATQKSDIASIYIEVVESLAQLGDEDSDGDLIPDHLEGYQDTDGDGIPNYLDRINECNVLPENARRQDGYLVESEAGVCLRRGDFTIGGETGGAQITATDIENNPNDALIPDPDAINIGGIFDYIAYGLPDEGMTFAITLPQLKPIPANAVYRKFNPTTGWGFFVEDANNSLWSTQGEPGYCPPPNSKHEQTVWTPGLTEGHWCVQLIIEDGGPNDDDTEINGTVVDPGGVSVLIDGNSLPEAEDEHHSIYVNGETTIDVLENATDKDGDTLILTSANASMGTVTIVDNQIVFEAPPSYVGTITINYGVSDNNGGTDQAQITIEIMPNAAPTVLGEESVINQGDRISTNLLENDNDPEQDQLTLTAVDNNQVSFTSDGMATFTPNPEQHGVVIIHYTVTDSAGNQSLGQWQVNITQVHHVEGKTSGGSNGLWILILLLAVTVVRINNNGVRHAS